MENGKTPAYPTASSDRGIDTGLTKKEYFTGLAMQGMLASCQGFMTIPYKHLAQCAIAQAEEILKQLENEK